jgi:hypothetical protein
MKFFAALMTLILIAECVIPCADREAQAKAKVQIA